MQNGQEILLSITIADDDMIWHVHMFPEVMFMDAIANTNRQKRDLFLIVVKDASGEYFIGNATLLPCGQLWMFTKLYQYFFYQLYGPVTLSRLRLALTDEDLASRGSFDAATHAMACYTNAKHMLCIFHTIVMNFHDSVYGKLPKNKGTRTLTASAALYGTYCFLTPSCHVRIELQSSTPTNLHSRRRHISMANEHVQRLPLPCGIQSLSCRTVMFFGRAQYCEST